MTYSKEHIADLLEKFMNGETSLDEEKALHEYFTSAEVLPRWKDYEAMFEYFDEGMPLAPASTNAKASEGGIFIKNHRFRNMMLAACMAGVAVCIALAVLAPKRQMRKAEDALVSNIQDSSSAASESAHAVEGTQAETPIAHIPENITSEPVHVLLKSSHVARRHVSESQFPSRPAAASAQAREDTASNDLVKQIRQQVIEIAARQAKAKIMNAVMASQGFVRSESENGAVVYVINKDENTIAL